MSTEHEANTPAAGESAATSEAPANTSQAPVASDSKPIENAGNLSGDTSETGAETPASEGDSDQPQRESRAKDRIQELVRRAKEAEAERDQLLAEKQQQTQQQTQQQKRDRFEYESDDEYLGDVVTTKLSEFERQRVEREQQRAAQRAEQARLDVWQERVADTRERIPDFEAVAFNDRVPYSQAMIQIVQGSDVGPEIAYHLGKNPQEADRISRLGPLDAAREIGRLESRFSQKARPKVSNAPPPVKTISGTGASEPKAYEDMSYDEYKKARGF